MTPEQLERLKQFRGARASIAPPMAAVRDAFIEKSPQMRGDIEQKVVPLRDDWLAFADEQEFISPIGSQAPGPFGRPLLSGQVTQIEPGFAMMDPTDMDLEPTVSGGEFDFQATGDYTPTADLPPEDRFTDLDFLSALERRPGDIDIGSTDLEFADPTAPLHPEIAEYLLYSPTEPKETGLTLEDLRKARENRATLEAEQKLFR